MKECLQCQNPTPPKLSRVGNPTPVYRNYCTDECMRRWNNENQRKGDRWYNYSLTDEDVYYMWLFQGGRCDICKIVISTPTCVVDHNHSTGEIRSLLCRKCNVAIGFLNESCYLLNEACNYLERMAS